MTMTMVRTLALAGAVLALGGCGMVGRGGPRGTPVVGERVAILPSERQTVADPSIAATEVILPAIETNTEWTQSGGNSAKSMGHVALGATIARAWTAAIQGGSNRERLAAAPIIANGTLYVMDTAGAVNAFDAATGARRWRVDTVEGNGNRRVRFGGGVSFYDGNLYATNGVGDVVQLDAGTGAIGWRKKPGGPLRGSPTIANGIVYALSQDNQLYALNASDGATAWTQSGSPETQGVFGVAAPAAAQGTVVVGFSSGEVNAYRYENGRPLWGDTLSRSSISTAVSSLSDVDADPVIDRGRVYVLGQGGRLIAVELTSGNRLWEQTLAGISTPWIAGDWLFVVTDDARLVCVNRDNGRIRWISQLRRYRNERKSRGPITWYGPVLAGNRLVLLNSLGQMVSAAAADGRVLNTVDTGSEFTLRPVVANNMLYTLDARGRLTAYR